VPKIQGPVAAMAAPAVAVMIEPRPKLVADQYHIDQLYLLTIQPYF
jgi:hypothetical protein